MTTAAKFVQPIPIFLAYLVPLDVDVVPIKFHQFLLMAAVAMETAKMLKKIKNTKMIIAGYSPSRN
jgi:cadmium resistance protein CadD (predicted permease)